MLVPRKRLASFTWTGDLTTKHKEIRYFGLIELQEVNNRRKPVRLPSRRLELRPPNSPCWPSEWKVKK